MAADQLVRIPVGYDLFRADVIHAACLDQGIKVRLIRNEQPQTGALIGLEPSYLLVRSEDADQVRAIVERNYPLVDTVDQ
jgi:hypothetical protein